MGGWPVKQFLLRQMGRFSIKGLGLVAQLGSLALVVEILGTDEFAIYAATLSVAAIVAQIIDAGFSRYSFRLIQQGRSYAPVIRWSIISKLVGLCLVLPFGIFTVVFLDLPMGLFLLALAGNLFLQLMSFSRYVLLVRRQVARCILLEVSAPILYFLSILPILVLLISGVVSRSDSFLFLVVWLYFLSFFLSFCFWTYSIGVIPAWKRGLHLGRINRLPLLAKGLVAVWKRSFWVGIEQMLSTGWYNLPVLLVQIFGGAAAVAAVALFQRLLNLIGAILSVTISSNLLEYYESGGAKVFRSRVAFVTGALTFSATLVCVSSYSGLAAYFHQLAPSATLFETLDQLAEWPIRLALATALFASFLQLSFVALGGDLRLQRCVAVGVGIFVLVAGVLAESSSGLSPVAVTLNSLIISQAAACVILLVVFRLVAQKIVAPPTNSDR